MGGSDLFAGTLDLLILRILSHRPMHAYGVGRILRSTTEGVLDMAEGVLYPALHRLEARGLVEGSWGRSESGRRARFYALTAKGRRHLEASQGRWASLSEAVDAVLSMPAPGEER